MLETVDEMIAGLAAYGALPFLKYTQNTKGAGYWHSLWTCTGNPAAGSAPGSANGAIPTMATAGALQFTAAGANEQLYLAHLADCGAPACTLVIYDRLWANSGLNGTLTTAQTWSQPALTRATDAIGVEAWLEVYTALGSTGVTATLTYTDESNNAGNTCTASVPASTAAGQIIPFNLASGDRGIKSTSQVVLSATTGTAGNFGITLMRRKAVLPIVTANIGAVLDAIDLGLPTIEDNSCLAMMVLCTGTNSGTHIGTYNIISK